MRAKSIAILLLGLLLANPAWALEGKGGGGSTSSGAIAATVSLTSAQLKALDLTPVTLLAAQGANKVIDVQRMLLQYKYGTRTYFVNLAPTLGFYYGSVAAPNLIETYGDTAGGANALFTAASSVVARSDWPAPTGFAGWTNGVAAGAGIAPTIIANQPLILGLPNSTYNAGPIATMTVANGGTGYAPGDTFTIDAGGAKNNDTNDAIGHVVTAPGGVVATVAIDTPGFSYGVTTANPQSGPYPTAHTSGAGDDALTVNVTGATIGDGIASISFVYDVSTLQ